MGTGRLHKATYSRNNRAPGYLVRVVGVWTGPDRETGEPVAIYSFEQRAKPDTSEPVPF